MDQTTLLKLPYILAAQQQKHVTHNEALRALDAIVQLAVADKDIGTPPASPAEGDRYIVAPAPSGAWAGQTGRIAAYQDGAWAFYVPVEGWQAWVSDEGGLYVFDGTDWVLAASGGGGGGGLASVNPVSFVGVNATADTTNRLSVSSPATLFDHEGDDHRFKINKHAATDTASVLFQTGYSGRAEFGIAGDDDFHVKVSPDGSSWTEALVISRSSGGVRAKAGQVDVASAATCNIGAAAAQRVRITGTTTITSLGSVANELRFVTFADALALTHNGTSLALPGAMSIATQAGDSAVFASDASGNWRCLAYQPASAGPQKRDLLTANRTYYVRTDGNDGNSGLSNTSGGAFLTPQRAFDVIKTLDLGGFTATISIGAGTFGGINFNAPVVGGNLNVAGAGVTTLLTASSGAATLLISAAQTAVITISGLKIESTGVTTSGVRLDAPARVNLSAGAGLEFGACGHRHIMAAAPGTFIQMQGTSYTISGNAVAHLEVAFGGVIRCASNTVTVSGTPAFSGAFAVAGQNGYMLANANAYTGAATGKRYNATTGGGIDTSGSGASYFPGGTAGTVTSPGWYL